MYEPKFKLNKVDEARLRVLVYRECCGAPGGRIVPLIPAEKKELKALSHKQDRKIWSHPKMDSAKRAARKHNRKLKLLYLKLKSLCH
jgi:hypothetical protein